jgi:ubiquinone/menaquinone biosynthesis C-methylase UbiE
MYILRNSVEAADYDYRAFDSPIFLQRYWRRKRIEIISRFAQGSQQALDLGCGSSRTIEKIPNCIGLDLQHNKLRWLRRDESEVVQADCQRTPFADGTFDCVIASALVDQVADSPDVIGEMLRLLKPGGTLILGTPDYSRTLWSMLEWIHGKIQPLGYAHWHVTHFTRTELEKRLRSWNLEIIACEYVGTCEMIFKARKPA